jgi:hypothetical protein
VNYLTRHLGIAATAALSLCITGCLDNARKDSDQAGPGAPPPSLPSTQPPAKSDAPAPHAPSNPSQHFKKCSEWDFSTNSDLRAIIAEGLELKIECENLDDRFELSAASMLEEIRANMTEIRNLPAIPKTIILSNYSQRALGNENWHLCILNDAKVELTNFIAREKLFQPLEQKLFSGNAFLATASSPFDQGIQPINATEFSKATSTLEQLAPLLKTVSANGDVKIVSLPFFTGDKANLAALDYRFFNQRLEIPYEANVDAISYFITKVVLSGQQFKRKANVNVGRNDLFSRLFLPVLNERESDASLDENFKTRCDYLNEAFTRLAMIADKFKNVVIAANARGVQFEVSVDVPLLRYSHAINSRGLKIWLFREKNEGLGLMIADMDALGVCLDKLSVDPLSAPQECEAKFKD